MPALMWELIKCQRTDLKLGCHHPRRSPHTLESALENVQYVVCTNIYILNQIIKKNMKKNYLVKGGLRTTGGTVTGGRDSERTVGGNGGKGSDLNHS